MRDILFTFTQLIMGIIANGQDSLLIDSLQHRLLAEQSGYIQIKILNELAWQTKNSDLELSRKYAIRGKKLAEKEGYKRELATSLNRLADVKRLSGEFVEASKIAERALKIERELNHSYGIARALSHLCTLYKNLGYYSKAHQAGEEALEIFKKLNMESLIADTYQRLALLYQGWGKSDKAIQALQQKLKLKNLDKGQKAETFSAMAKINKAVGSFDLGEKNYFKALKIWEESGDELNVARVLNSLGTLYIVSGDEKKAKEYHLESIAIKEKLGFALSTMSEHINLGIIAGSEGNLSLAKQYYRKAISIRAQSPVKRHSIIAHFRLGNLFQKLQQNDSALYHYQRVLSLNPESLSFRMELYWNLSNLYFQSGDLALSNQYKADYTSLRDSLESIRLNALRSRDEYEAQLHQNEILKRDNEIKSIEISQKNQLLVFIMVGSSLSFALILLYVRNQRIRKNNVIAEKTAKINQQKVDDLLKNTRNQGTRSQDGWTGKRKTQDRSGTS